ncbi:hypothetical protein [Synechococcus sp. R6-6]|uniref:hypothetical protein n=1 Tax=Synechococcus sp. R6-6 TaxID=2291957 RepID=UPI0039C40466
MKSAQLPPGQLLLGWGLLEQQRQLAAKVLAPQQVLGQEPRDRPGAIPAGLQSRQQPRRSRLQGIPQGGR